MGAYETGQAVIAPSGKQIEIAAANQAGRGRGGRRRPSLIHRRRRSDGVDELGTTVDVGNGLLELGPHRIHLDLSA